MGCYLCGSNDGTKYSPCPDCVSHWRKQKGKPAPPQRFVEQTSKPRSTKPKAWMFVIPGVLAVAGIAVIKSSTAPPVTVGPSIPKEEQLFKSCLAEIVSIRQLSATDVNINSPHHKFNLDGPWSKALTEIYGPVEGQQRILLLRAGDGKTCSDVYEKCADPAGKERCAALIRETIG